MFLNSKCFYKFVANYSISSFIIITINSFKIFNTCQNNDKFWQNFNIYFVKNVQIYV